MKYEEDIRQFSWGKTNSHINFLGDFCRHSILKKIFFQVSIKRGKSSLFSLLSIHVHTFQHTAKNNFNA